MKKTMQNKRCCTLITVYIFAAKFPQDILSAALVLEPYQVFLETT